MEEARVDDGFEVTGDAVTTTKAAKSIKAIDRTTVHKICSGQVVLTLGTAVKELVENSIDAGATSVEIRLRDHGLSMIEVSDNGRGVEETDFEGLTLKHHTSKIQDFGDLVGVKTFGFRGEALSSLCALSDLVVTTRHCSHSVATKLVYDHNGKLLSRTPCPRQVGTTVTLNGLFSTLPVRHKEFQRNIKKEFTKMVQVLTSYCLISTGIRISCTNQSDKGKKNIILSTSGHPSLKDNISSIFGAKQASSMLEFKQETASDEVLSEYGVQCSSEDVKGNVMFTLEGFISSCEHGQGRSAADRQFYFINSRPCDPSKVMKIVNEVYHHYNRHQYPCVVLNIRLKEDDVDINVTPDKRQILVNNEKILLATIKTSMIQLYGNIPSSFKVQNTSLNNSFSSPLPSKGNRGSPASGRVSALTQRFGRKSEGSPLLDSPSSQLSPISVPGLKRSFSNSSCTDDSPSSKQPKLELFLTKSKSEHGKSSSESIDENALLSRSFSNVKDEVDENGEEKDMNGIDDLEQSTDTGNDNLEQSTDTGNDNLKQSIDKDPCTIKTEITESLSSDTSLLLKNVEKTEVNDQEKPHTYENHENRSTKSQDENANPQINNTPEKPVQSSKGSGVKSLSKFSRTTNALASSVTCKKAHSATDNFLNSLLAKKSQNKYLKEPSTPCVNGIKSESVDCFVPGDEVEDASIIEAAESEVCIESPSKENNTQTKIIICEEYNPCEIIGTRKSKKVNFDIEKIRERLNRSNKVESNGNLIRKFRAKITPGENSSAEDELRKEISKDMFSKMEILGQFNLGFIIARFGADLFIIDQHATDEKYNFETLQATCTLQNQRLIIPQSLELTAANESVLLDNVEIFQKNGFEFKVDEEKPVGQRVCLVSMPISRGWEFGRDDVDELIFMLSDSPGVMCRPTRVRAMFASRACRKSVMIGTALTKAQMQKLVCHMGEIEQPWNCPHGRPTMRHLINLNMVINQD